MSYFQYFPMDKQMCTLEIESFGYTMSDLKFRWEDGPKSVQASETSPSLDLTTLPPVQIQPKV